jgi:hypothetical protein
MARSSRRLQPGGACNLHGHGASVVPLTLDEWRREPDQWFRALESITEHDPVPPGTMGKVRLTAQTSVTWRDQQGMLGDAR